MTNMSVYSSFLAWTLLLGRVEPFSKLFIKKYMGTWNYEDMGSIKWSSKINGFEFSKL